MVDVALESGAGATLGSTGGAVGLEPDGEVGDVGSGTVATGVLPSSAALTASSRALKVSRSAVTVSSWRFRVVFSSRSASVSDLAHDARDSISSKAARTLVMLEVYAPQR